MTPDALTNARGLPIATRNGRPAYECPPEPRRAAVPMREWLARKEQTPCR